MEFHNAALLPKGLPEIMATVTPHDISPWTKVIAFRRKDGTGALGSAGYNQMTDSFEAHLYPTLCCSGGGRIYHIGTLSFKLWKSLLETALHEVGHLATRRIWCHLHREERYSEVGQYVERLADQWMVQTLARILRDDARLGQPVGALTGYPGVIAYRVRNWGRPWNGEACYGRISEWRALGCEGQITMCDIACKIDSTVFCPVGGDARAFDTRERAKVYRVIHQAADAVGANRFFVNRNGRRYRMFNAAEADRVWGWLEDNRQLWMPRLSQRRFYSWEYVEGNWELVELESAPPKPIGQFVLPSFSRFRRAYGVPTR